MRLQTRKDWVKAFAVGIGTALLLSLVIVPMFRAGVSPLPKPLGLAFAQRLLGPVPLPVGLLFHVVYVTAWSLFYVLWFERLTLRNALLLGLLLWLFVLVVFFPMVGWGFFGLDAGRMLPVAALVPHLLFAFFVWALSRWAFPRR